MSVDVFYFHIGVLHKQPFDIVVYIGLNYTYVLSL